MLSGTTTLIAHLGYPTYGFRAPLIYNPWFEKNGIDAVVVPMGVRAEDYAEFFRSVFRLTNIHGALVTMPHKVRTTELVDDLSPTARVAGAVNAVVRRADGSLYGDQFDGAGFVRGLLRKGFDPRGTRALVVGNGGVGSPIAASLAEAGVAALGLSDLDGGASDALRDRLTTHFPELRVTVGPPDVVGYDLVVNASPLGMTDDDALPIDVTALSPDIFVGDVVMRRDGTPLLREARARGCPVQAGEDMLFEQIPAYLEFFGFGTATPDELRAVSREPT
jgi:shikimate dehydrogenase